MRFAQVAGISALVYISLIESDFLLSYSSKPIYKKDLTEQEVHTVNGLVNKSIFKRIKKEGKIVYIRNHQINENEIKVRMPLKEAQTQQEETALDILVNNLRQWEGFKDKSYDDYGQISIGYGRQAKGDTSTTLEKEEAWLRKRAREELEYINNNTRGLNKHQQAAAASTRYNVGSGNFEKSKAFAALKAGDHATFEREAYDPKIGFVRANGEVVKGLQNRRQKELELFRKQQQQQKQQIAQLAKPKTTIPDPNKKSAGQIEFEKDPMAYRLKYGGDEFDA